MRPEDELQKNCCTLLDAALAADAWYCAIPNGAVLKGTKIERARQMKRLKATGLKPGAPDLMLFRFGRAIAVELKAGKGTASDNQQTVQSDLRRAEIPYYIARSVDELHTIIKSEGLTR